MLFLERLSVNIPFVCFVTQRPTLHCSRSGRTLWNGAGFALCYILSFAKHYSEMDSWAFSCFMGQKLLQGLVQCFAQVTTDYFCKVVLLLFITGDLLLFSLLVGEAVFPSSCNAGKFLEGILLKINQFQ